MWLTMLGKTSFHCPEYVCRKKFTSDSCRCKHINLYHPEHLQVACHKSLTISSSPRRIEPAQHREFNTNNASFENLHAFPYLEYLENITDFKSQPPPPPQSPTEIYSGTCPLLIDFITEPWKCNAESCLVTNWQINPNYPFAMHEEYQTVGQHSGRLSE